MSDEQPIKQTFFGDWLFLAARVRMLTCVDKRRRTDAGGSAIRWFGSPIQDGYKMTGYYGDYSWTPRNLPEPTLVIALTSQDDRTQIVATERAPLQGFWRPILDDLAELAGAARELRHFAIGHTFDEILDAYYAAIERGEQPSLKAMARHVGANYDSLRQAKVRYDAKRRVSGD